jgi:hypothetical protein
VEITGYVAAGLALVMAAVDGGTFSLALAIAGVAALGVALRADRRGVGVVGAAVLLTAASWVRLVMGGVEAPEPYTVPPAVVVLVLGHVRRRREPGTGSWAAYGSGLGMGMLPALWAAWDDVSWVRPLVLGAVALVATLVGARRRLQAPLLMGGGVLLVDALHELAPAVVQSLGVLPRWVPLAAAGGLLLYVGATYERRLAAGRRLRENVRRME